MSSNLFTWGLIGVGVIGESILEVISKSNCMIEEVSIADKREDRLIQLRDRFRCEIVETEELASRSQNVLLAIKPQDVNELLAKIGKKIYTNQRVISFAAGKTTASIEKYLNVGVPVIRVMPNTPMFVGEGASAISAGKYATQTDVKAVEELLKASGKTIVVDESLQDAVTATSGSGPAYFFKFVEAMIAGAKDLGLSEADARILVIQTITGAAAMLNQEGADPGALRQNVTSPNGTTYAALQVFEGGDLEGLVKRAMKAARDRSQELS
jgi:pyrroline-5-carboxylate reductase